jgi:hypothetical protein
MRLLVTAPAARCARTDFPVADCLWARIQHHCLTGMSGAVEKDLSVDAAYVLQTTPRSLYSIVRRIAARDHRGMSSSIRRFDIGDIPKKLDLFWYKAV